MKPEVICHIMSSVDGRLLPARWTAPFDETNPATLFKEYAVIGRQLDTECMDVRQSHRPRGISI